jgi:hypothetical protein
VDRTVVLAVSLGLGSLLLWSLMILVEDMASTRRRRGRHRAPPGPVEWADVPPEPIAPRETRVTPPVISTDFDDRFEQLVDNWFGPDEPRRDRPERRSA